MLELLLHIAVLTLVHSLLFNEALCQLSKCDRVLSSPGGHLLLIGRSGVGRRQAVTLAAYMQVCVLLYLL